MGRMLAESKNPAVIRKVQGCLKRVGAQCDDSFDAREVDRLMRVIEKKCAVEEWPSLSSDLAFPQCTPSQQKAIYNILSKQSRGQSLSVLTGGGGSAKRL